jgi:hypothetical protein
MHASPESTFSVNRPRYPVPLSGDPPPREVTGVIENVIADVPPPRTTPVSDAPEAAQQIAREAAKTAAVVSG